MMQSLQKELRILCGSLVGACIMFSNPAYTQMLTDTEHSQDQRGIRFTDSLQRSFTTFANIAHHKTALLILAVGGAVLLLLPLLLEKDRSRRRKI